MTIVEYVWIDGQLQLRSKARVLRYNVTEISDVPEWNYDGSSTNQASSVKSEVFLRPCAMFSDPFRCGDNKIVLCETYTLDGLPGKNNNRNWANNIFNSALNEEPWFGLEQEYFLLNKSNNLPVGEYEVLKSQGDYYCGVGSEHINSRNIVEEHLQRCLYAGVKIAGINAEVAPGQWEFQIGPCVGIEQGDHLWMARYLLQRVAENHGVVVTLDPKPLGGEWNGSGCHANYSTKNMREGTDDKAGMQYILDAISKLSTNHNDHMKVYGEGNEKRLTGIHETSSYDKFTYDISSRDVSIRIGSETEKNCKGYFEDRRPSSNCDPYLVTGKIFETTITNK
jgi:glutamine synthetase